MNPFTGETTWNLETKIGLPIFAIIILGCFAAAIIGFVGWRSDRGSYNSEGWATLTIFSSVIGLFTLGFALFGYYPYDKEYHSYSTVHGSVTAVDKRLIASGDAMSERYVITVAGQPFGVDDTRAATVREGDTITLACKKEWVYASTDGWACRWLGNSPK